MTDKIKYGLLESDLNKVISVLSGNSNVEKLVLFGSRAKGSFRNGSDIDIALYGKKIKLRDVLDLTAAIDDLSLPYKFDLILFHQIKETDLIEHIERVGIPLFERTPSG